MVMLAPGGLAGLLVTLWQRARQGAWRRLWPGQLALAASAFIAVSPIILWVELTFRLQQADELAPTLSLLGLTLDARSPASWLGSGVVGLLGAGLWLASRRWLARKSALVAGESAR